MTTDTGTILNASRAAFDGERPPSFLTPEFKNLLSAARGISTLPMRENEAACALIGRQVLMLILDQRRAAMITERHIAIISRDASRPPQ